MSNAKKLADAALVVSVEEVRLKDVIDAIPEAHHGIAQENAEQLYVYRMTYRSQRHTVVGFVIEPRKGRGLPCAVFNRGGSREFAKIDPPRLFTGLIPRIAKEGYIVIASQYSGNDGGEGVDEFGGNDVQDVLNLYKILKSYPRADTSRIGMIGGSRGGLMTYLCLPQAKWVKAAVVMYGSTDLVDKHKFRPEFAGHMKRMFGGSLAERKKRSVLYWAEKLPKKVPLLIMHGTADWRVNPQDSLRLAMRLQDLRIPYKLIMFEGADHNITEFMKGANGQAIAWLNRYVRDGHPLPNTEPHGP